ncbi:MAG: C39 family peptidase [Zavarzinella sp.]
MSGQNEVLRFQDLSRSTYPAIRIQGVENIYGHAGNDLIDLSYDPEQSPASLGVSAGMYVDGGAGNDVVIGHQTTQMSLNGGANDDYIFTNNITSAAYGWDGFDEVEILAGQRPNLSGFEKTVIKVDTDDHQEASWSCGPNSVARFMRAYGIQLTYAQAKRFTEYDGNIISYLELGTPPSQLIDTMQHWKPDSRMEKESTTDRLKELVLQGKPAIILVSMGKIDTAGNFAGGNVGELHYVVVNGYDARRDTFLISNTNGEQYWWKRRDLEYKWNWSNDFSGWIGGPSEGALRIEGFRDRTLFY